MSAQINQSLMFGNDSGCNIRICPWVDEASGDCSQPTALDCWSVADGTTLQTQFTIPQSHIFCHYTIQEDVEWAPVFLLDCSEPIMTAGQQLCMSGGSDWKMSDCSNLRITTTP